MTVRQKNRSKPYMPIWGYCLIGAVIVSLVALFLTANGTLQAVGKSAKSFFAVKAPAVAIVSNEVASRAKKLEEDRSYNTAMMRGDAVIILGNASPIISSGANGYLPGKLNKHYLECLEIAEKTANKVREYPMDDPAISEARSHLVEMTLEFQNLLRCFEFKDDPTAPYYRLPKKMEFSFARSAASLVEHYKRIDLLLPVKAQ